MGAAIGHLGHDTSADVVGWLWVVMYVGICTVLYSRSAIPFQQGDDENPCWCQSCRRGRLHTKLVIVLHCSGRNIIGE